MTPEVAKKLLDAYPEILGGIYFECDDGWADVIDDLCAELRAVSPYTKCTQCKEKFGVMRFYCGGATDAGYEAINQAEMLTMKICEHCGEEGKLVGDNWVKTLCEPCAVKWEARIR